MIVLFLRSISIFGILLFGTLFTITLINPIKIEHTLKPFIVKKLKLEINKKIDSININKTNKVNKFIKKLSKNFLATTNMKLNKLKEKLKLFALNNISNDISELNDEKCKCRELWTNRISEFIKFKIITIEKAKKRLSNFTKAKYMDIVNELIMDIRIFAGVNSLVLIFIFFLLFIKKNSEKVLIIPSVLMFISVIVCSYFYLFEQNWFYSVLFNDYIGFSYILYLFVIFLLLCDITFNDSKLIKKLLEIFSNLFSSSTC